jgi:hypothetical protein
MLATYSTGIPMKARAYQATPTRHWTIRQRRSLTPGRPATTHDMTTAAIKGPRSPGVVRTRMSGSGNKIRKMITKAHVQANASTKYETSGCRLSRAITLAWIVPPLAATCTPPLARPA